MIFMAYLVHEGVKRESGRYPWGSGEVPYQHESWFDASVGRMRAQGLDEDEIAKSLGMTKSEYLTKTFSSTVKKMRAEGKSDKEIYTALGMSSTEFRKQTTIAKSRQDAENRAEALKLMERNWSNVAIAEKLGVSEGTVRNWKKPREERKSRAVDNTADAIRDAVEKKGVIDVGDATEMFMGVSKGVKDAAVKALEQEGYALYTIDIPQVGSDNYTHYKVLAKKDISKKDIRNNLTMIQLPDGFSYDNGQTMEYLEPPNNISSKRVMVRYKEDGGSSKDGVIELRRGVDDISLGNNHYAQVRIGVDGTHYLKGMAVYSDDLPDGIDIRFNTNKSKGTPMLGPDNDHTVLKRQKEDPLNPNNPFGATIKQMHYEDGKGNKQLSAINLVNPEGTWGNEWSNTLSAQVLSKQTPELAKKQLGLDYKSRKEEYDRIMALENPAIKSKLLSGFADECESAAVHLKAAAMPRQGWHVLLPVDSLKDNEIYAPDYENGETVVLIRYPHAGRFEIPELKVNNKNKEGISRLGTHPKDAVGINSHVAAYLSGADFDGDSVLVIPNNDGKIKTTKRTSAALKSLMDFDPKDAYPAYEGMPRVGIKTGFNHGVQMGMISNLITDMTIKGAETDEIVRAVKHSMVIVDAEKHNLNWRQSEKDQGIAELKKNYQDGGGVSTLISRAKSEEHVLARSLGEYRTDPVTGKTKKFYYDPDTGERLYTDNGRTKFRKKVDRKTGEVTWVEEPATMKTTKMELAKDARDLSSGSVMEEVYADYANSVRSLGRKARVESGKVEPSKWNRELANTVYKKEVDSLNEKYLNARMNAPLERRAQAIANTRIRQAKRDNPDMTKSEVLKKQAQYLAKARVDTGSAKHRIYITDEEWEAIQAGAVSYTRIKDILNESDQDRFRDLATPKVRGGLSSGQVARAKAMLGNGLAQSEVAKALGVSVKTLMNEINS